VPLCISDWTSISPSHSNFHSALVAIHCQFFWTTFNSTFLRCNSLIQLDLIAFLLSGLPSDSSGYDEWVRRGSPLTENPRTPSWTGTPWEDIFQSCKSRCLDLVQYNCHCSTGDSATQPLARFVVEHLSKHSTPIMIGALDLQGKAANVYIDFYRHWTSKFATLSRKQLM
jgi:hypothetical protein